MPIWLSTCQVTQQLISFCFASVHVFVFAAVIQNVRQLLSLLSRMMSFLLFKQTCFCAQKYLTVAPAVAGLRGQQPVLRPAGEHHEQKPRRSKE